MSILADLLSTLFDRRYTPDGDADDRPVFELFEELLSSRGEVSGVTLARRILERYETLDDAGRKQVFEYLRDEMDIDVPAAQEALATYRAMRTATAYAALARAVEPGRQEWARRMNQVPGATGQLVRMRTDLLRFARDDDTLSIVDQDFRHLFKSWFNRGFLVLRSVNWSSPASLLEKIIAYESVHEIRSWDELRSRLEPEDRRCFAFFHPVMPDEPLIFVEVALTRGIPGSIQQLLATDREPLSSSDANTAVFYSISNCQAGLAGISFGNSLIKQVVSDLSRDLPNLENFVTLSPMPRLVDWIRERGLDADALEAGEIESLAAWYLLEAKTGEGAPLDPVARFHLNNGATVYRIHTMADTSAKGVGQSAGAMVTYLYDAATISQNHEDYANEGTVAASRSVRDLAERAERSAEARGGRLR